MTTKTKTWPSTTARKAAYEAMELEAAKANGHGYEPPIITVLGKRYAEIEEERSRAYTRYTFGAMDRLAGMITVAALIEGKTEAEILKKVRGY